jgi:L-threonylcarbamoyladenylate synthase
MAKLVDLKRSCESSLQKIKKALAYGELVAIPSETVYGLGANIYSKQGIERIYKVKNRPSDNPLICHIENVSRLEEIAFIPHRSLFEKLIKHFWPGALTFVLPKKETSKVNYASLNFSTVAVRMPSHPIFLEVIKYCDFPIAAPSANLSGRPSPTHWQMVQKEVGAFIPYIIKSAPSEIGIESTVLDMTGEIPTILRPGKITKKDLINVIPHVRDFKEYDPNSQQELSSPGLKYKHYKPCCEVVLSSSYERLCKAQLEKKAHEGFIGPSSLKAFIDEKLTPAFFYHDSSSLAHGLYYWFYALEELGLDRIYVIFNPQDSFGKSIAERVERSADIIL